MNGKTTFTLVASAILTIAVAGFMLTGGAVADDLGNITADQPDNQTVEADIEFSADTDATLELTRDGSIVESTTVSGLDGETETAIIDLTGLDDGDFSLHLDATDASVDETRMVTHQTAALNVSANDTVQVDIGYDADELTESTIEFDGEAGSNTTTVEFDPVAAEDGSGVETAEWDADNDGTVDVTVTTDPAASQTSVHVGTSSGGLGGSIGIIGDSPADIPPWMQAVGALVAAFLVGLVIVRFN